MNHMFYASLFLLLFSNTIHSQTLSSNEEKTLIQSGKQNLPGILQSPSQSDLIPDNVLSQDAYYRMVRRIKLLPENKMIGSTHYPEAVKRTQMFNRASKPGSFSDHL